LDQIRQTNSSNTQVTGDDNKSARMERLARREQKRDHSFVHSYSRFVRLMRLALPLCALAIVVVLYVRSGLDEQVIQPVQEEPEKNHSYQRSISRNELLNPKFESVSKQDQPYEITAQRAVQGEANKDLIMLDRPLGKITMKDGLQITLRSNAGAYRQDTGRFFLEGDVYLEHDGGYTLQTQEAHIDLKKGYAWSEKDVAGSGPDIKIAARGVRANSNTGEIVFTGPATLTLDGGVGGLE